MLVELAHVIQILHQQGVAHLDLNYKNVLYSPESGIRIKDLESISPLNYERCISLGHPLFSHSNLIKHMGRNKRLLIKPELDIYSLTALAFFLLEAEYWSNNTEYINMQVRLNRELKTQKKGYSGSLIQKRRSAYKGIIKTMPNDHPLKEIYEHVLAEEVASAEDPYGHYPSLTDIINRLKSLQS